MSETTKRVTTNNRQIRAVEEKDGEVFFFPKHNPPMSVRAASRKEAERLLAPNEQEV